MADRQDNHHAMNSRHGRMGHWRGHVHLTDEEIDARVRERFARFDRNSDGSIDRSEVEAMMAQNGDRGTRGPRHGGSRHAIGGLRGRHDDNRDGKVSKDEFRVSIERRFAQLDLDSDGRITEADLPPTMRGIGILSPAGVGSPSAVDHMAHRGGRRDFGHGLARLRAADVNGDGAITREEFVAQADKQFSARDRNADGSLDQADRDILRKEMVDYRVLRLLHRFGGGKEGKISREQFTKVAKERMTRLTTVMEGRDHMGYRNWHRRDGERGHGPRGRHGFEQEQAPARDPSPAGQTPGAPQAPGVQPGQSGGSAGSSAPSRP